MGQERHSVSGCLRCGSLTGQQGSDGSLMAMYIGTYTTVTNRRASISDLSALPTTRFTVSMGERMTLTLTAAAAATSSSTLAHRSAVSATYTTLGKVLKWRSLVTDRSDSLVITIQYILCPGSPTEPTGNRWDMGALLPDLTTGAQGTLECLTMWYGLCAVFDS